MKVKRAREKGFTLLEMMVASGIAAFLILSMGLLYGQLLLSYVRSVSMQNFYSQVTTVERVVNNDMSKDGITIAAISTNYVEIKTKTTDVQYQFSNGKLLRNDGASTATVATGLYDVEFSTLTSPPNNLHIKFVNNDSKQTVAYFATRPVYADWNTH